jgi:hypothetical protein
MSTTRIQELIAAFDCFDGEYKRDEVEEAITLQEQISPALIAILEEITADPEKYAQGDHLVNSYAVALLAHFQEPAAHLPIIHAFTIPEAELNKVWGDMVTMTLPTLLVQTCDNDLNAIRDLILNRETQEFVRGAAIEALSYAVAKEIADREEVIDFLSGLLTGEEAEEGSYFWSSVVSSITDMHPLEAMESISQAFEKGLVDPSYIGMREIERDLERPREEMMAKLRATMERRIPRDVHGYLAWFSCFRESHQAPQPVNCALRKEQNKKRKSRTSNKQAKKSRKKNRK